MLDSTIHSMGGGENMKRRAINMVGAASGSWRISAKRCGHHESGHDANCLFRGLSSSYEMLICTRLLKKPCSCFCGDFDVSQHGGTQEKEAQLGSHDCAV